MIRIPVYLAVAQWALLGGLGVLVVIMYRQLGRFLTGTAKEPDLGPQVGSQAAPFTYLRSGEQDHRQLVPGGGQPLLLAFADPTCPSCEELVSVLGELEAAGDLAGIRTLVLISDPPAYLQMSDVFCSTRIEVGRPASRNDLESYRASATPLLVAVDGGAVVRAAGSVIRAGEVRAFARSCLPPAPVATLAAEGVR